jgi:alpha-galactosidase/6-phospho-beta-glucosidase family protein
VRLAVVGAGSTYTPELVDGLIRMRDLLPVEELALHETDEERLRTLGGESASGSTGAALHGGRERVFRALLAHPLVGHQRQAERLTDLLIDANRRYLPWA